jgi:uncharacterized membrane protein YphA (DoxX/SURF4 family)
MQTSIKSLLFGTSLGTDKITNIVYLLFRLHVGISIALGAGLSKVFHKINEKGSEDWSNLVFGVPDWFVKQVGEIGFTFISPSFWAHLAVYGEFLGGLFIAFGFLTRLSALQLTFQFFVIAFVWYDEPSFIRGMYYQQLFFWAFALIAALGGGVFSLDRLIASKNTKSILKPALVIGLLFFGINHSQAQTTQNNPVSFKIKNASILPKKLTVVVYEPDVKGNGTFGFFLMPTATRTFRFKVGTKVYLVNQKQVDVVMSGKRIDKDEPFLVVKKEDEGKVFKF